MEVDQKLEQMEVKDDDDEGSDDEESSDDDAEEEEEEEEVKTYLPGVKLEEGEELEIDEQAYVVYHQASLGPPCLSFDLLPELSQPDFPLHFTSRVLSCAFVHTCMISFHSFNFKLVTLKVTKCFSL